MTQATTAALWPEKNVAQSLLKGRLVNAPVNMAFEWNWGDPLPFGLAFSGDANRTKIDAAGIVHTVGANVPRNDGYVYDKNGLLVPGWLLEGARNNLIVQSQNIAAAWIPNGIGTTMTGGFADPFGTSTATQVSQSGAGASSGGAAQVAAFGSDGEKCISVYVKQGTAPLTWMTLYDTTLGHRHLIQIAWSGGVPTLSTIAGAGALFTPQPHTNGWWRILWSATGVVAAHSNEIVLYASDTTNNGATFYVGAQVEEATFPSSYIPTGATAVTRAAESADVPWVYAPQAMTMYAKGIELGTINTALARLLQIGNSVTGGHQIYAPSSAGYSTLYNGITSDQALVAIAIGDTIEVRSRVDASGSVNTGTSDNGAAEVTGTPSGGTPLITTFASPRLCLGGVGGSRVGFFAFQSIRLALGSGWSLDQMRKAAMDPGAITFAAAGTPVASLVDDGTHSYDISTTDLTGTGRIALLGDGSKGAIY